MRAVSIPVESWACQLGFRKHQERTYRSDVILQLSGNCLRMFGTLLGDYGQAADLRSAVDLQILQGISKVSGDLSRMRRHGKSDLLFVFSGSTGI